MLKAEIQSMDGWHRGKHAFEIELSRIRET
jgi:hypothetical protein